MANNTYLHELPFYNITTSELIGDLLHKSDSIKEDLYSSFYKDILNICDNDAFKQLKFSYCTDCEFNRTVHGSKIELSVFHLNIRSLNKNHSGLIQLLQLYSIDFDVLVLSEIWNYNLEFYVNIFKNYNFYYCVPVTGNIGGIGMFVKKSFACNELTDLNLLSTSDCPVESLWLELDNGSSKYILGGIYRHPGHNINTFCSNLETSLESVRKSNIPCVLAGDFNIDLSKYNLNRETSDYLNTTLLHNFMPMIVLPTRITRNSSTLIDHIYYCEGFNSNKDFGILSGNFWSDVTDHLPNYFIITKMSYNQSKQSDRPLVRIFSERNMNDFKNKLKNVEWDPIYNSSDIDDCYSYFDSKINECYQSSFKHIRLSRKRAKDKKWVTNGLKRSCRYKNKLFRKWLHSKSPSDEEKYKKYRSLLKKLTTEAKKRYYKDLFDMRTNSIKQLWNNLSQVASLGKNKCHNSVSRLLVDNVHIEDPKQISDLFNKYFCNVGAKLQNKLNSCGVTDYKAYLSYSVKNSMYCPQITKIEILDIIAKLKNNKSPGPDNITPNLIKYVADEVIDPLLYMFNLSFTTGTFPSALKLAKVTPVYKKGDKRVIDNYRPISLLNVIDKILEKLMYSRVYSYLCEKHLLSDQQFGFRRNHSTSLALIDVIDEIYQHLDKHDKVIGIFLDLKKAFDTIDHSILLHKLYQLGIRGTVHDWFKNYLHNRNQYVCVNGVHSEINNVSCGVPQGSVLGPLLFLLYVNDIGNSVPDVSIKLYADDTNLFIFHKSVESLIIDAGTYITRLNEWFAANKLSLSIDKTCYSMFGVDDCDKSVVSIKVDGVELKQVESTKYLGIIIDSHLNWGNHIDYLYRKLIKFTSIFYKIRGKLPTELKKIIYFAFVHSQLSYGIEIYGNTYPTYLHKLNILNNKILRILQNAPRDTRVVDLYNTFNALTIPNQYKYNILLFVHKFFHHRDLLPHIFWSHFAKNYEFHPYNTRNKYEPHYMYFTSSVGQKSIKYQGTQLWCSLPDQLKIISSTRLFKRKLKSYLQTTYQTI